MGVLHKGRGVQVWCHSKTRKGAGPQHRWSQLKEEQQRKLLPRFPRRPCSRQPQSWNEEPEPSLCLSHPNMPMLIHTSKRKSFQDPDHPRGSPMRRDDVKSSLPALPLIGRNLAPASKGRIEAPGKRCAQTPSLTCVNPPKKPRLSPVQTPQQSTSTADLGAFLNLPPPPSTAGRGPRVAARVSRETPVQGQRFDLQPPADRSPSRSMGAVSAAHPPPIILVPAKPLRMLFLRDSEGCWSCRYMAPPPLRPADGQPLLLRGRPSIRSLRDTLSPGPGASSTMTSRCLLPPKRVTGTKTPVATETHPPGPGALT
ncbi:hypothetical protein E5288_WYG001625 [Bos mutus]|uniref:Uncharacterized protein n=1 Tax=Bos mutus TaxID=72004 RepID=A0A6B0SDR7_9CETA|nr:hypothetical protein [Bos mutus]